MPTDILTFTYETSGPFAGYYSSAVTGDNCKYFDDGTIQVTGNAENVAWGQAYASLRYFLNGYVPGPSPYSARITADSNHFSGTEPVSISQLFDLTSIGPFSIAKGGILYIGVNILGYDYTPLSGPIAPLSITATVNWHDNCTGSGVEADDDDTTDGGGGEVLIATEYRGSIAAAWTKTPVGITKNLQIGYHRDPLAGGNWHVYTLQAIDDTARIGLAFLNSGLLVALYKNGVQKFRINRYRGQYPPDGWTAEATMNVGLEQILQVIPTTQQIGALRTRISTNELRINFCRNNSGSVWTFEDVIDTGVDLHAAGGFFLGHKWGALYSKANQVYYRETTNPHDWTLNAAVALTGITGKVHGVANTGQGVLCALVDTTPLVSYDSGANWALQSAVSGFNVGTAFMTQIRHLPVIIYIDSVDLKLKHKISKDRGLTFV